MLHDPEFLAGQAYPGMSHGINPEFDRFQLYHGGIQRDDRHLLLGKLPYHVQTDMNWPTGDVYGTWDFAMKGRFEHGLSWSLFNCASTVIECGDIHWEPFRGPGRSVVFTLRLRSDQPYWLYMPCKLDRSGLGVFAKTIWFGRINRGKWKKLWPLMVRGGL